MVGAAWRRLALPLAVVLGAAPGFRTTAPADPGHPVRVTVLFDNTAADPRLSAGWGFAVLIEVAGHALLFDAGGDAGVFAGNLDELGIDPGRIEAIVVSHAHGDHTAGLGALAARGVRAPLYGLAAFRATAARGFRVRDAAPGQELIPGVFTTGEMVDPRVGIPEQALVIPTDSGLVVLTGCAHPGIVAIVRRAAAMFHAPVFLVAGGFHLLERTDAQVDTVAAEFRRLGVRRVGATHCTGERAIARLRAAFGADFVPLGAGSVLVVGG